MGPAGWLLEGLLDEPMVGQRDRGNGLLFLVQFLGEPAGGLANLLDEAPGLVALRASRSDLGLVGRIKLAQGIGSQPGVVGVEGHLEFSFLVQARASTG